MTSFFSIVIFFWFGGFPEVRCPSRLKSSRLQQERTPGKLTVVNQRIADLNQTIARKGAAGVVKRPLRRARTSWKLQQSNRTPNSHFPRRSPEKILTQRRISSEACAASERLRCFVVAIQHSEDVSDPKRATESPAAIIGFRTVMIKENTTKSAITKESAAEFPHFRR